MSKFYQFPESDLLELTNLRLTGILGDKKFISKEEVKKALGENEFEFYLEEKKKIWTDGRISVGYARDLGALNDLNSTEMAIITEQTPDKKPTEAAIKKVQELLHLRQTGVLDDSTQEAVKQNKKDWWVDSSYSASVQNSFAEHIKSHRVHEQTVDNGHGLHGNSVTKKVTIISPR